MALTADEIENLRFHLGYGNMGIGAAPYTSDGFYGIFTTVIGPNLAPGTETMASTTVAPGIATIGLAQSQSVNVNTRLVVDVGDDAEIVVVKWLLGSSVTARFALAHESPYPVATLSGLSRLRMLLHAADKAFARRTADDVGNRAAIKRAEDVEFFPGFELLNIRGGQYKVIQRAIASLVCVPLAGDYGRAVEVY